MSSGARAAAAIARKDIVSQARKRFEVFSMFLFALISVLAFSFAVAGQVEADTASALVWVIIFLTGMFGFAPVFISEAETGTLRGLSVAPVPSWSVYIGKVVYGFVIMGIVEVFLIPICMAMLNFSFTADPTFVLFTFAIGTLDLAAVGAMASALTMPAESKSTVYPLVYFPTATSALILLVEITRILVSGPGLIPVALLLQFLVAHLLAMTSLSGAVFHFTLTG
ncbi:MAG: heme exporter protein CcmB [Candidatus Thorarchaeota archaeon]|nr:MAG: heme exporter protein CcmB [Candidatus Thorarchaeota archaeon]